eukprot:2280035-Rhodomonas_salina.2
MQYSENEGATNGVRLYALYCNSPTFLETRLDWGIQSSLPPCWQELGRRKDRGRSQEVPCMAKLLKDTTPRHAQGSASRRLLLVQVSNRTDCEGGFVVCAGGGGLL